MKEHSNRRSAAHRKQNRKTLFTRRIRIVALSFTVAISAGLLVAIGVYTLSSRGHLEIDSSALPIPPASSLEAAAPVDPQPIINTVHFSATGDNLIHNGIYLEAQRRTGDDSYNFAPLYENLSEFYSGFDVNWINQETLITDEIPPSSYPQFCTPAACGQALYDLGMRVISMSNNHAYDQYAQGIAATRRFWASMPDDVVTTGFWAGESDYNRIPIHEVNGIAIAYLSYTDSTNGIPLPENAEANVILTSQENIIQHQIALAKANADVVVVGFHWGVEGSHTITDTQRALAQKAADWGADIIIGTHPHVVQSIEILQSDDGRSVPVAYSLGNFVSTQAYAENMICYIFTCNITKSTYPDGSTTIQIDTVKAVPSVTHYDAGYKNIQAYLFRDYTPDLALTHGCRGNSPQFSYEYIQQVISENIDEQFIEW